MRVIVTLLAAICLSACGFVGFPGVYKIDVEQGNIVTQEMVDQLQPGMTRRQVRFILGTPLVEDTFNQDRWDYLYSLQSSRLKAPERQRLTVWFTEDKVSRIENVGAPTEVPAGQTVPLNPETPAPASPPAAPVSGG